MAPGACVDRYRPACCAAVENFVHARHRDAHKQKLTRARSLINNGWSVREEQKLLASRRNVKNDQQLDDRFANIERENMRLLIRMQEIGQAREGQRRRAQANGEPCVAAAAAARIVLGAPQQMGPAKCMTRCASLPAKGRGSNSDARMRELRRIDSENQKLMKRLTGTKATVSNNKMEEQHQAQQRVMRMRQEKGPKMPPSRVPLPFDAQPEDPDVDLEGERIQDLHAEMQRRLEELERMDGGTISDEAADTPPSARSAASDAGPQAGASADADEVGEKREYVGGQLPEHSRALVEKLMQEMDELEYQKNHPAVRQQDHQDADEEAPEDDRDAVAKMLAAADALDAHEPTMTAPDYMSYESVVQRSRAALQAAAANQRLR